MQQPDTGAVGTEVPGEALSWYEHQAWRFAVGGGALRYVSYAGVEIVRAIAFLSRDAYWGVNSATVGDADVDASADGLTLRWPLQFGTALSLECGVSVAGDTLRMWVSGKVRAELRTSRTGFVVLHPIDTLAGKQVVLDTPEAAGQAMMIAREVNPAQPIKNIRALHFDHGPRVTIAFQADQPFEMEDQRNWTDASFKTYFRPLALPFPYTLHAGDTLEQSVRVDVTGTAARAHVTDDPEPAPAMVSVPSMGLVWLDDEPAPDDLTPLGGLAPDWIAAQLDLRSPKVIARARQASEIARQLGAALRLRLILDDAGAPDAALRAVAEAAGPVEAVHALPAAFLHSYQPDGQWPDGMSCAQAQEAARAAFPGADIQAGMLTFFPEFNRHRPQGDYDAVSFGTAAIVHDADDLSVMETLQALPDVIATAHASATGKPVDIGLATLGLWANPYGGKLVDNPQWQRCPLAKEDPRIRGLFGAAWLVGYLSHAGAAHVRSVGVGTISGALGLLSEDGSLRPLAHVLPALRALGQRVTCLPPQTEQGWAAIMGPGRALVANITPDPVSVTLPGSRIVAARLLDAEHAPEAAQSPDWILQKGGVMDGAITLPSYAIALLEREES